MSGSDLDEEDFYDLDSGTPWQQQVAIGERSVEGWLEKKGEGFGSRWKRRWFVLRIVPTTERELREYAMQGDSRTELRYFEDSECQEQKGSFYFHHAGISQEGDELHIETSDRTYRLRLDEDDADDHLSIAEWVTILTRAHINVADPDVPMQVLEEFFAMHGWTFKQGDYDTKGLYVYTGACMGKSEAEGSEDCHTKYIGEAFYGTGGNFYENYKWLGDSGRAFSTSENTKFAYRPSLDICKTEAEARDLASSLHMCNVPLDEHGEPILICSAEFPAVKSGPNRGRIFWGSGGDDSDLWEPLDPGGPIFRPLKILEDGASLSEPTFPGVFKTGMLSKKMGVQSAFIKKKCYLALDYKYRSWRTYDLLTGAFLVYTYTNETEDFVDSLNSDDRVDLLGCLGSVLGPDINTDCLHELVRVSQAPNSNDGEFEIVTSERAFRFRAASKTERDSWISEILKLLTSLVDTAMAYRTLEGILGDFWDALQDNDAPPGYLEEAGSVSWSDIEQFCAGICDTSSEEGAGALAALVYLVAEQLGLKDGRTADRDRFTSDVCDSLGQLPGSEICKRLAKYEDDMREIITAHLPGNINKWMHAGFRMRSNAGYDSDSFDEGESESDDFDIARNLDGPCAKYAGWPLFATEMPTCDQDWIAALGR